MSCQKLSNISALTKCVLHLDGANLTQFWAPITPTSIPEADRLRKGGEALGPSHICPLCSGVFQPFWNRSQTGRAPFPTIHTHSQEPPLPACMLFFFFKETLLTLFIYLWYVHTALFMYLVWLHWVFIAVSGLFSSCRKQGLLSSCNARLLTVVTEPRL